MEGEICHGSAFSMLQFTHLRTGACVLHGSPFSLWQASASAHYILHWALRCSWGWWFKFQYHTYVHMYVRTLEESLPSTEYTCLIESFRSPFTLNVDIINHHVTPSAGNVHGEILTLYTPGTMFHYKRHPVGSFLVQRFLFHISWLSMFSLISLVSE